jgi:RNA-directed DNA polymerase
VASSEATRQKLGATLHRYADDGILGVPQRMQRRLCRHSRAIALRMGLTINRDKTRITKLTEGFDFIGFQFVRRRSPNSGKP